MFIVIPTEDKQGLQAKVANHFGRCLTYTFLDKKGNLIKIIPNTSQHSGGQKLPPELMKKEKADILLCKELGPQALILCHKLGITVYTYSAKTVSEIFNLWKKGIIQPATSNDTCQEHKH